MKQSVKTLCALLLLLCPSATRGAEVVDGGELDSCFARMEAYLDQNPQEKVYLSFDNSSYYVGEKIWFKAHVVDDRTMKATPWSRVLYVDLVNAMGFPVGTYKYKIEDGSASGCIELPDSIVAGYYEVRGYTAWMLNFAPGERHGLYNTLDVADENYKKEGYVLHQLEGNAGIFSRVFPVYDAVADGNYDQRRMTEPRKVTTTLASSPDDKVQIDFYPEGGHLVKGVPTVVAFEAHKADGKAIDFSGEYVDGNGNTIPVRSTHEGRGSFKITPGSRGGYVTATIEGKQQRFRLPDVDDKGVGIQVTDCGDCVRIRIARNAATGKTTLGLAIVGRGTLLCKSVVDLLESDTRVVELDKTELKTGVNAAYLFNASGKMLARRCFFVNNHDWTENAISCALVDTLLEAYQPITISLSTDSSQEGKPFLLSVVDADSREDSYATDNALTSLLLSSEIKGFVPHADYYFAADDSVHRRALDELMLVRGWSRFSWEELSGQRTTRIFYPVERGLEFRGRLAAGDFNTLNGAEMTQFMNGIDEQVWVSCELAGLRGGAYRTEVETTDNGYFKLRFPDCWGDAELFLFQSKYSRDKMPKSIDGIKGRVRNEYITWRDSLLRVYTVVPLNVFPPIAKPLSYYETTSVYDDTGIVLPEVERKARRRYQAFDPNQPLMSVDVRYLAALMSNLNHKVESFHYDNFNPSGLSLLMKYLGIGGGMDVRVNNWGNDHYVNRPGTTETLPKNMEHFPADENFDTMNLFVQSFDRSLLYQEPRTTYLNREDGAIVNFKTTERMFSGARKHYHAYVHTQWKGYERPVEFYQPNYAVMPLPEQPDYRRTLYWNPAVEVDSNGNAAVTFYNNSSTKRLHITIDDLMPDGTFVMGH